MSEKNMKESFQSFAVKKVLHYMDEDPDTSMPKLLEWADKFDKDNLFASQYMTYLPTEEELERTLRRERDAAESTELWSRMEDEE